MAGRRCISSKITESDPFYALPESAQALYLHLNMQADDDGFINNAASVSTRFKGGAAALKKLVDKRFVLKFDDVYVIKHWRISNSLKNDRLKPLSYASISQKIWVKGNKAYTDHPVPGCVTLYEVRTGAKPPVADWIPNGIQTDSAWIPNGFPTEPNLTKPNITEPNLTEHKDFGEVFREIHQSYPEGKAGKIDGNEYKLDTYARNLTYKEDGKIKVHTEKAETWRLSLEDLQAICTSLTAQQRQYVDGVQQFLTEFGRYGDKVNMELYGIKLFNKENAYFPLKSDRDYRKSVETQLGSTMTAASLKNDGMTKKTVPGANNPIVLEDFDRVVFTHLDKMVNYANLVLPLENLRRVFDYQTAASEDAAPMSMKALIQGTFGTEAEAYINQFLTDANGTRMGMSINPLETMFARSKGMAVSANLSVMIQQVSAVVRAAAEIAPQHLLWAAENRKGTKLYDELVEYAPIAVIKDMGGFDTGSNRSIEEYIGFEEAPKGSIILSTNTMTVTDSEKHFAALSEIGENVQSVIYNLMFLVSAGKDWNLDGNVASAMYCAINYLTMLHSQLEDETAALFALSKEGKA